MTDFQISYEVLLRTCRLGVRVLCCITITYMRDSRLFRLRESYARRFLIGMYVRVRKNYKFNLVLSQKNNPHMNVRNEKKLKNNASTF